jgi:hypothetical protein
MHAELTTIRTEQGSHQWNNRTRSAVELLESAGHGALIPTVGTFQMRSLSKEVATMKRQLSVLSEGSTADAPPTANDPVLAGSKHDAHTIHALSAQLALQESTHQADMRGFHDMVSHQDALISALLARVTTLEQRGAVSVGSDLTPTSIALDGTPSRAVTLDTVRADQPTAAHDDTVTA